MLSSKKLMKVLTAPGSFFEPLLPTIEPERSITMLMTSLARVAVARELIWNVWNRGMTRKK